MAVDSREMVKARRRLEQSLEQPTITNALSVLDKAVGGLIDLAKGRNVIDGAPGTLAHSPFGSDVAGGATNVFGKAGGMPELGRRRFHDGNAKEQTRQAEGFKVWFH